MGQKAKEDCAGEKKAWQKIRCAPVNEINLSAIFNCAIGIVKIK